MPGKILTIMKQAGLLAVDILFPSRCIICSSTLHFNGRNLCEKCYDKISFIHDSCPVCSGIIAEGKCTVCTDRAFYPRKNISIVEFSGVAREVIHHFKFNKKKRLVFILGEMAFNAISKQQIICDMVTFVPMNPAKKYARGYNQTEIIARYVSLKAGLPCESVLKESRRMKHQKDLGYHERFYNTIGRFKVKKPKKVAGKRILIIDDVFTTGATINECSRVLREAGAGDIFSVTIARTGIKNSLYSIPLKIKKLEN